MGLPFYVLLEKGGRRMSENKGIRGIHKLKGSPFSKADKKERLKMRKAAYKQWLMNRLGYSTPVNLRIIARDNGMTLKELQYYMEKDRWQERFQKDKENGKIQELIKQETGKIVEQTEGLEAEEETEINRILNSSGLSERWKLFILYYLQSFNARQAAIKAGYTEGGASAAGIALLKDERVVQTLTEIKSVINKKLFVDANDVLQEYIKIAFADMTDFVEFKDNKLTLKDSDKVDGKLITEIKQGRDGITVKLADKMKALEKLEKLFDLIPDRRLELDIKKFELQKQLAERDITEGKNVTIIDDI